jgi:trimethylamine:corrinoid methyltransferase-like protein
MRTADATSANPESILVDLAVKQLFDQHFGGHLWTEVLFSPSADEPGLLAVYQNFYAAMARARLTGDASGPYPGMGTVHNGSTGSPTQLMLDMEIRKSQHALRTEISVNEDTVPYEEIVKRATDKDHFLHSDHTLSHWRELWNCDLLPLTVPAAAGDVSKEKAILDKCEERWRTNLERWEPPDMDEDRMKALQQVLKKAEAELL